MASYTRSPIEKWVALYVRLSRDDDNEGDSNSISHQVEILTKYAKEHGIENFKIYKDDGFSGTNFNRPGFQEMMSDIESGLVSMVVVKDMSRFGRNYLEVGMYTEIRFPEMGVRFIAVNDGVDSEREDNDFTPFRNIINGDIALDPVHPAPPHGYYSTQYIIYEYPKKHKASGEVFRKKLPMQGSTRSIAAKDGRKRGKQGKEVPTLLFGQFPPPRKTALCLSGAAPLKPFEHT